MVLKLDSKRLSAWATRSIHLKTVKLTLCWVRWKERYCSQKGSGQATIGFFPFFFKVDVGTLVADCVTTEAGNRLVHGIVELESAELTVHLGIDSKVVLQAVPPAS